MKPSRTPALLALPLLCHAQLNSSTYDPLDYVDPLIGSRNGGNVFPGATRPYALAKPVADTNSTSNQGGFTTDGAFVTGFSSAHDSGTGGAPSLGNFQLFPYPSCQNDTIDGCALPKASRAIAYRNGSVRATLGFFVIELENGVQVSMTSSAHTALYQFDFASSDAGSAGINGTTASSPFINLDLTDLQDSRQDNASVSVDPQTGRMTGNGRFLPSFGSGNYVMYFCVDFKGPAVRDAGIWVDSRGSADVQDLKISRGINSGGALPGGGFVQFSASSTLLARVGLSFRDSDQACALAESEIPDYDFDATHEAARSEWREKLSPIRVSQQGVNDSFLRNFYSGIYRTMVNPQNYTGVVPEAIAPGGRIWFDSFYCLWDSFRSQIPFLTVLDTSSVVDMLKGLLNIYQAQGWLPDCHMSLCKGYTQGGSNADNIFADGYAKIKNADVDWPMAYEAVVKDAEEEPYDWCCEGRGGLDSWKRLGYVPVQDFDYKGFGTHTRSISRTLEYSYNDFCISRMAAGGLGDDTDVQKYQTSSENWQNLFKASQNSSLPNGTDTGFTGFFQPKYLNETWGYQNPLECSNIDNNPNSVCSLQNNASETFESSIWEYAFFVPHDQARLIALFGGPQNFVRRLNYLHDRNITYIGNEPAFLTVFQYHYAGRPALSAQRSHFYIPRYFQPTPEGLPGNDDSGAMGSFVAFAMLGLFPNPGQDVYLITPPFFAEVAVTSPVTGKTARVRSVGFDASYRNIAIQRATLDGEEYSRNWIDHSFFTEGKELVLYLGSQESQWGTRVQDLPPSLSAYQSGGTIEGGNTTSNLSMSAFGRSPIG